jgi:hypothetical protein
MIICWQPCLFPANIASYAAISHSFTVTLLKNIRQKEARLRSLIDFMADAYSFLLLFSSISSLSASTDHSVDLPGITVLAVLKEK